MGNARVKEEHDTCSVGSFVEQIMALYPEDGDKLDVWDLPVFMGIWDEVAGCATEAGPIKAIQLGEFNQLVVCGYPYNGYDEDSEQHMAEKAVLALEAMAHENKRLHDQRYVAFLFGVALATILWGLALLIAGVKL